MRGRLIENDLVDSVLIASMMGYSLLAAILLIGFLAEGEYDVIIIIIFKPCFYSCLFWYLTCSLPPEQEILCYNQP